MAAEKLDLEGAITIDVERHVAVHARGGRIDRDGTDVRRLDLDSVLDRYVAWLTPLAPCLSDMFITIRLQ